MPTIALLMDHFLTVYQTTLRDAIVFEAKSKNVNLLCLIGRALDSPFLHERVQNAVFEDVTETAVAGIILMGTTLSAYAGKERVDEFCLRYSLPVCNIGLQLSAVPSIVLNNRRFKAVVEHLITTHKCKRIAYISGPRANEEAEIRREAYLEALKLCGVPFYPELEKIGKFTLQSGYEAATELLEENQPFDALVVANDDMALGAMGVLKARGIRIPEDVRVTGFDDTLAARFNTPALTTMRQPIESMGRHAVDLVLRQIAGETVPLITEFDPVLYCRQSCGCNPGEIYQTIKRIEATLPLPTVFANTRAALEKALEKNIQIPKTLFGNWIDRVLSALEEEFSGQSGRLLTLFQEILDAGGWRRWLLDELQSVIGLFKEHFPLSGIADTDPVPERIWHGIQVFLCDASTKEQMRQQVDADLASTLFLKRAAADVPDALTRDALVKATAQELEAIGILNAAVMVYQKDTTDTLDIIVAIKNGARVDTEGMRCDATELMPALFDSDEPKSFVIVPLSAGSDHLGRMVLELGAPDLYYEMLREHLSSNLKSIESHQLEMEKLRATADAHRHALELQHRQKLESLGLLAGSIASDFNNVLSVMMGNLDVALLDLGESSPLYDVVLECKAVAKHSAKLCTQLLVYSGKREAAVKRLNLNRAINDLEDLLMLSVQSNAKLVLDLKEGLPDIEGDAAQLNQLLVSLVINASDAVGTDGGTIKIRTAFEHRKADDFPNADKIGTPESGSYVILEVTDSGVNAPDHPIPSTTDETGGLMTVLGIIETRGWDIHIENTAGAGRRFEILIPPMPKISGVPLLADTLPISIKGQGTVLLVDSDPGVLRMGERLLKRIGFSVLLANSTTQARQILRDDHVDIKCVILDVTVPKENGVSLTSQIQEIRPSVPLILTSPCADTETTETLIGNPRIAILQKPYDFGQLNNVLEKVLR